VRVVFRVTEVLVKLGQPVAKEITKRYIAFLYYHRLTQQVRRLTERRTTPGWPGCSNPRGQYAQSPHPQIKVPTGPLNRLLEIWKRFWEGIAIDYNTGTGCYRPNYPLTPRGLIRTKSPSPDNRPWPDYWTDFESENGFEKVLQLTTILVQVVTDQIIR
jgi:hypothetical protein